MFTPSAKVPCVNEDESPIQMTVGDFAEMKSDAPVGKNREGGAGFVVEIVESNKILYISVRYQLNGNLRSKLPLNDVTISDYQETFCKVRIPRTQGKKVQRTHFIVMK